MSVFTEPVHCTYRRKGRVLAVYKTGSNDNFNLAAVRSVFGNNNLLVNLLFELSYMGDDTHQAIAIGKGGKGADGLLE